MAKKTNLKAEKAKRNQEYALQFKKKKKRPQAARPAYAPAPEPNRVASFGGPTAHDVVCNTCGVETTVLTAKATLNIFALSPPSRTPARARGIHYFTMPEKPMNARVRIPAVTRVMPGPSSAFGTSASSSRSRIPAMMLMAIVNPSPPPKPAITARMKS